MSIKEKIEEEAHVQCKGWGELVFKNGADFAIKAVVEMLEERRIKLDGAGELEHAYECELLINLLKSEV